MARSKKTSQAKTKIDSENLEAVEETNEFDPFSYLFSDYDPETVIVTIARLTPEEWQGVNIKGYLGKLSPGHDEEYIKNHYGGGKFILNKKNQTTGRMIASKTIVVSGNPKIPLDSPPGGFLETGNDYINESEAVKLNIGGTEFPYTGDIEEMKKFILFTKAVKTLFPDPPDYNLELLRALIENKKDNQDIFEQIKKVKDASDLFQTGTDGSSNIYDFMGKVVQSAAPVLANLTSMKNIEPNQVPISRQFNRPAAGLLEDLKQEKLQENKQIKENKTESLNEDDQPEGGVMSETQVVMMVVNVVVNAWRLDPPKETNQVVTMIDQILQQKSETVRAMLANKYSSHVLNFAENELAEDWLDPESKTGSREDFKTWLTEIFETYGNPEREVVIL